MSRYASIAPPARGVRQRIFAYLPVTKGIYYETTEAGIQEFEICEESNKRERLGRFPAFERCRRLTFTGQLFHSLLITAVCRPPLECF